MRTSTKILTLAGFGLLLAAGIYEGRSLAREAESLDLRRRRLADAQRMLAQLTLDRAAVRRDLALAEKDPAARDSGAAAERALGLTAQTEEWLAKYRELKRAFETRPDQAIPEMRLLTDLDWLGAARQILLDPENDYRSARGKVRDSAKFKFASRLAAALVAFEDANQGMLPTDLSLLLPYFKLPIDPTILLRYELSATGKAADLRGGAKAIVERLPVDAEFDIRMGVQATGGYGGQAWPASTVIDDLQQATARLQAASPAKSGDAAEILPFLQTPEAAGLFSGIAAYQEAHDGREPNDLTELRPYVTNPEGRAELERLIKQRQSSH